MSKPMTIPPQCLFIVETGHDLFAALEEPIKNAGHKPIHINNGDILVEDMDRISDNCGGVVLLNADRLFCRSQDLI